MTIFPAEKIEIDFQKIDQIKHLIDLTLRLITFSREHYADDLLDAYIKKTTTLKELLSIRNAQMEAESEEEVEVYTKLLDSTMSFITNEIVADVQFHSEIQLFQLFRLVSPDSHSKHPNKYRQTDVQIGRYFCPNPSRVPGLVSDLFYQMKLVENPIVRAIYFHHELIRIHPFSDGNGRTTRMAKNWMLMYKLCPPIFISDSEEKKKYIATLERSFLYLDQKGLCWNEHFEIFFNQELDRLIYNTTEIYNTVKGIGTTRNK